MLFLATHRSWHVVSTSLHLHHVIFPSTRGDIATCKESSCICKYSCSLVTSLSLPLSFLFFLAFSCSLSPLLVPSCKYHGLSELLNSAVNTRAPGIRWGGEACCLTWSKCAFSPFLTLGLSLLSISLPCLLLSFWGHPQGWWQLTWCLRGYCEHILSLAGTEESRRATCPFFSQQIFAEYSLCWAVTFKTRNRKTNKTQSLPFRSFRTQLHLSFPLSTPSFANVVHCLSSPPHTDVQGSQMIYSFSGWAQMLLPSLLWI